MVISVSDMTLTLNTMRQDTTVLIPSSLPLSVLMDCFHLTLLPGQVCFIHTYHTHTHAGCELLVYLPSEDKYMHSSFSVCVCVCDSLKDVLDGLCASQSTAMHSIAYTCKQFAI